MSARLKPPPARARSLRCGAWAPDSAKTGYPYAFQRFDEKRRAWVWLLMGCSGTGRKRPSKAVRLQAESEISNGGRAGWYRWVWVKRWIRRRRPRGWTGVIDPRRSSAAVWVDRGRWRGCEPLEECR